MFTKYCFLSVRLIEQLKFTHTKNVCDTKSKLRNNFVKSVASLVVLEKQTYIPRSRASLHKNHIQEFKRISIIKKCHKCFKCYKNQCNAIPEIKREEGGGDYILTKSWKQNATIFISFQRNGSLYTSTLALSIPLSIRIYLLSYSPGSGLVYLYKSAFHFQEWTFFLPFFLF